MIRVVIEGRCPVTPVTRHSRTARLAEPSRWFTYRCLSGGSPRERAVVLYAMSNSALVGLTKAPAREVGARGLRRPRGVTPDRDPLLRNAVSFRRTGRRSAGDAVPRRAGGDRDLSRRAPDAGPPVRRSRPRSGSRTAAAGRSRRPGRCRCARACPAGAGRTKRWLVSGWSRVRGQDLRPLAVLAVPDRHRRPARRVALEVGGVDLDGPDLRPAPRAGSGSSRCPGRGGGGSPSRRPSSGSGPAGWCWSAGE